MVAAKAVLIAALSKGKRCQTTHEKLRHRKKMKMEMITPEIKMMIMLAAEEEEEEELEPERKICRELMDLNKKDVGLI